jgi:hypothetical protein
MGKNEGWKREMMGEFISDIGNSKRCILESFAVDILPLAPSVFRCNASSLSTTDLDLLLLIIM